MLTYDEAVHAWGISKLSTYSGIKGKFDTTSVEVEFIMDEGYSCCGGSDPNCYCSYAESPSLQAEISYRLTGKSRGPKKSLTIAHIDFAETLKEMFALSTN